MEAIKIRADDVEVNTKAWLDFKFEWEQDTLRIQQRMIQKFEDEMMQEICSHYDCDLSEFKEWLDNKRKETQCKYTNVTDVD